MNYDVPDLERKLQSFRTVTLPAEDHLELMMTVDSDFLTQKSICAASTMVTEFFVLYFLEHSLQSISSRDAA